MILDLQRFIAQNRTHWQELEALLDKAQRGEKLGLETARRLHYLYERSSADLSRISTFASEMRTRQYLSTLVARAYAEIYRSRGGARRFSLAHWMFTTFPATFQRHFAAFALSVALTLAGCGFGAFALAADPTAKHVIMPFPGLVGEPGERVKQEEASVNHLLLANRTTFSAQLMTHNTRIAILTLALGVTWGVGSALLLFYNGVILGAVAFDYVRAGYGTFLLGWLMPHGVIEIPAILIAGQAALVLASALIGSGDPVPRAERLRSASHAIVTLIAGAALLLVWAGLVESFVSQFHAPVVPYGAKIAFGVIELALLVGWLAMRREKSA